MGQWYSRPLFFVADVERARDFYVGSLGFTEKWSFAEAGKLFVAQVNREDCEIILSSQWPEKNGKGIILMHDIQPHTAKALPALLAALKTGGYKVVNMKSKDDVKTLAEYDAMIEKDVKGLPAAGAERPMSSVIRTVP